ncbi:MAG TPA: carboxypeptidase regulatory-like domain-containing protein [Gemmatimonadales bacterium]|nr:carboxypeptidase regulatory-like domain-containing protein [Gemmatimonadales bacterium]
MHALLLLSTLVVQQSSIRGTVISAETREPIGFTRVTLSPQTGSQFTDAGGAFQFAGIPAGTYLLSVRQIGYVPVDTQLVLDGVAPLHLTIGLRRLAIELPPITVAAVPCVKPGAPDSSDAALLAVFEQLQESARRYRDLANAYPFQYTLELSEREINQRGDTGRPYTQRLRFRSSDYQPYEVGRVVAPAWGPWGNPATTVVIRSAELEDLGNETFIANHCFRLAGLDTLGGTALVRIDFEPAQRIRTADMAGSAFLHPDTYELRYTITSLTRPERSALADVRSLTFQTRFRNIAPGVPLQDSLTAVTTYRYGPPRRAKIETQRTLDVRFRRGPPPP